MKEGRQSRPGSFLCHDHAMAGFQIDGGDAMTVVRTSGRHVCHAMLPIDIVAVGVPKRRAEGWIASAGQRSAWPTGMQQLDLIYVSRLPQIRGDFSRLRIGGKPQEPTALFTRGKHLTLASGRIDGITIVRGKQKPIVSCVVA